MRKRGQLSKAAEEKRAYRIIYLRDEQHKKQGTTQLLWREIGVRFGMRGEAVAIIYKKTKAKLKEEGNGKKS